MSKDVVPAMDGELLIYPVGGNDRGIRVLLVGGSVWLTQRQMAELYGVSVPTINEHLAGAQEEGEIEAERTIRKFRIVQLEDNGQRRASPNTWSGVSS